MFIGHFVKDGVTVDAGVIDNDIQPSESLFCDFKNFVDVLQPGDICHAGHSLAAAGFDFLCAGNGIFLHHVAHNDLRALPRQFDCDPFAQAAPGSGDDCYLTIESSHCLDNLLLF